MTSPAFQTSSQLPKGIQFQNVKPLGVFQEFKDYIVTPIQTYSNSFSQSDIVRIQFNIQDWYIDPYESYIEAEVALQDETPYNWGNYIPGTTQAPKFYMMDGPSTSLINDFRLEVNSREIERIREYDQLGNLLMDLNVYPDVVDQKDFEGYFSIQNQYPSLNQITSERQYTQSVVTNSVTGTYTINNGYQISNSPFQSYCVLGAENATMQMNINTDNIGLLTSKNSKAYYASGTVVPVATLFNGVNIAQSVQSALAEAGALPCDPTINVTTQVNNVIPQTICFPNTGQTYYGTTQQMFGTQTLLGSLTMNNSNFGIFGEQHTSTSIFNPCQHSPKLDQIDGHNIFLTNLNTAKIVKGQFTDNIKNFVYDVSGKYTQSRAYMQIPLLSGVMGVLIPQDRWQLIPSNSLGQCNLEFRFNENAFYSHDGTYPLWRVTKFQLRLRMYRFDQNLQTQLRQTVNSGIQLHSQIFSMGPIYSIQPNVSINNNWQLNNGIPSIKQLFFWFLSNDFELYPNCRKNYKLSQNLTSMQLKLGSNYIPQQPIVGQAGCVVRNFLNKDDNSVFLSELQQAVNILFDTKRHININKLNFSINDRPYDPTMQTLYGLNSTQLASKGANGSVILQQAKDYGYSLYNEMRCRGKAIYTFNLEMDKKNDDTITGMNTTKIRPIELILKSDDGIPFQRQSTLYVMYLSDFIVTFNGNETTTEGYG